LVDQTREEREADHTNKADGAGRRAARRVGEEQP
jgi:hypothetical protein